MKPIIGLLPNLYEDGRSVSFDDYIDAIRTSGGIPLILPEPSCTEDVARLCSLIDGLIIPGGQDICPRLYGEEPHYTVNAFSTKRDSFEAEIFRMACAQGKPILGICRGAQLINALLGGSLTQDIPSQLASSVAHRAPATVADPLTYRHEIVACDIENPPFAIPAAVNSFHHQAIKNLGDGLIPLACSRDGVIEAYFCPEPFIIATQWHPERITAAEEYAGGAGIFKALIDACTKK